jgi:subtilisin family serine protease
VLSVAGVDTRKRRVGYSSQGPGRLDPDKPDLSAYTHFLGSGVYPNDGGTSAACPVAAGVVAAVREKYPSSALSPAELRALLFKTAEDLGGTGFDHDFGWGVIDGTALAAALAGVRRSSRGRSRSRR